MALVTTTKKMMITGGANKSQPLKKKELVLPAPINKIPGVFK